jgi:hypothetical protein
VRDARTITKWRTVNDTRTITKWRTVHDARVITDATCFSEGELRSSVAGIRTCYAVPISHAETVF